MRSETEWGSGEARWVEGISCVAGAILGTMMWPPPHIASSVVVVKSLLKLNLTQLYCGQNMILLNIFWTMGNQMRMPTSQVLQAVVAGRPLFIISLCVIPPPPPTAPTSPLWSIQGIDSGCTVNYQLSALGRQYGVVGYLCPNPRIII